MSEINLRTALEIAEDPGKFFNEQEDTTQGVNLLCAALETIIESWHAHHLLVHALSSPPLNEALSWVKHGDMTLAESLKAFLDGQHHQMQQTVHAPAKGRQ